MGKLDRLAALGRLDGGQTNLQIGEPPAAVVNGRSLAGNRRGKFIEHQVTGAAVARQRDRLAALIRIDEQSVGRLPDIAALTAYQRQPEVRQVRCEAGDCQVQGAEVAAVTNVGGFEAGAALLTRL